MGRIRLCVLVLASALLASACGGGSDSAELEALREEVARLEAQATTPPPTATVVPAPTTSFPESSARHTLGGKIAFINDWDGDSEIYVMNSNGTGVTRLTDNDGFDGEMDWSPDGYKIAFDSDRDGDFEIYVMNANGTGVQQLTDNTVDDRHPVWSPDGTRIAFSRGSRIFMMNADGTGITQLTDKDGDSPEWSGDKIAFTSDRADPDGPVRIFVMNADGTGVTQLTDSSLPFFSWRIHWGPAWSPDGNKIAFLDGMPIDPQLIYVMNADGTGITQLPESGLEIHPGPVWSPDGDKIAFSGRRDRKDSWKIFVMNADGSNVVSLGKDGVPESWGG